MAIKIKTDAAPDERKKSTAPSESETSRSMSANESAPVDTPSRTFRTRAPNGSFDKLKYQREYHREYRRYQRAKKKAEQEENKV